MSDQIPDNTEPPRHTVPAYGEHVQGRPEPQGDPSACGAVGYGEVNQQAKSQATTAMILGIVGLVMGFLGVILGPIAVSQAKKATLGGADATAGRVLGLIATILGVVWIVFTIAYIILIIFVVSSQPY